MPALKIYGKQWHIASDDVPLFALLGLGFHALWCCVIGLTSTSILSIPSVCHHAGRQYIAVVVGLFTTFGSGAIIEIFLILEGCRGGMLELSKRRRMPFLLTLRFVDFAFETIVTAYGTYVVFFTHVRCKVSEIQYWDPRNEVLVLIILTWCFQVFILINAIAWYNAWPNSQMASTWESKFLWLGKWICCRKYPLEDGTERQRTLRRIARWVAKLMGPVDLTPSDVAMALILVATLQHKKRREHIQAACNALTRKEKEGPERVPLRTKSETLEGVLTSLLSEANAPELAVPQDVSVNILSLQEGEAGVSTASLETSRHDAPSSWAVEGEQYSSSGSEGSSSRQETAVALGKATPTAFQDTRAPSWRKGPLGKYYEQMCLVQTSCVTPSGMAEDLGYFLPPDAVLGSYTGNHWHVPAATLAEVSRFAKFAEAVYSIQPAPGESTRWHARLLAWWRKRRQEREDGYQPLGQSEAEATSERERHFYAAIMEFHDIPDSELLYCSFENAALAHLPYMICLDPVSKSVILAVRGTATIEDVITDSLAEPELLTDWLPDTYKQKCMETGEKMYAHAGIVGAASAVLQDLKEHGILHALLDNDYSCQEDPSRQEGGTPETAQNRYVASVMLRKLDCKGWRLVLTGHSLGAGACALMALWLRDNFSNLQCYAFCPPGGLMSSNLSKEVQDFVLSVAVGKDIVSRMSMPNIGRLIDELVVSLALCKVNKMKALLFRMSTFWRHEHPEEIFWAPDRVPQEAVDVLERYDAAIQARNLNLDMILPGKVIFLRPLKVAGKRVSWDACWVGADEVMKEGIMVSPRLLEDHYTTTLLEALKCAQRQPGDEGAADTTTAFFPEDPDVSLVVD